MNRYKQRFYAEKVVIRGWFFSKELKAIHDGKVIEEDKCKNCEYYINPDYTRCKECEKNTIKH